MPTDVFSAIGLLARVAAGSDPHALLKAALREGARRMGADLVVLYLPDGPSERLDLRVPRGSSWPSAALLRRWQRDLVRAPRFRRVIPRTRGGRPRVRQGAIMPLFTGSGTVAVLGAFSSDARPIGPEPCAVLALLAQSGLARIEAVHLQRQAEAHAASSAHDHIAREIHDGPLQMLTGALIQLRLAMRGAAPSGAAPLAALEADLAGAIRQMRALIRNGRAPRPGITLRGRVASALHRLQQARGIAWTLRWRCPEGLLMPRVAGEIYMVINEALANVYRHSQAHRVGVHGCIRDGRFEVVVRDDGVGFDVAEAIRTEIGAFSFGLVTMRERMSAVGGSLALRSQPGRGTRVVLSLPLRAQGRASSA